MPQDLQIAYRLLLLGQPVSHSRAESVFLTAVLQELTQSGLLQKRGSSIKTPTGRGLISLWGKYLWVDDPTVPGTPAEERVYIGWHSYLFAAHLRPMPGGQALDMGTGSGLLAQLCADHCRHVVATDVDPKALTAARVNAAMNGLHDRIEVLHSDLFANLAGRRFDYICANTPCIPVPSGVTFPNWAAGGEDGLDFLRRILKFYRITWRLAVDARSSRRR